MKKQNKSKKHLLATHLQLGKVLVTVERKNGVPATMKVKAAKNACVTRTAVERLRLVLTLTGTKTKMRRVTVQFGNMNPALSFDLIGQFGTKVSLPIPSLGQRIMKITVQKIVFEDGFTADTVNFEEKDTFIKTVGKAGKTGTGLNPKQGSRVRHCSIGVVVE